ncbi:MAG: carboxypeptidase-like regulatory domain-containing protein [Gemmatimonadaceae bacterium]
MSGTVVASVGGPLPYSTVSIRETGAERFANDRGEFVLVGLAPGSYHLRVKELGFAAVDTLIVLSAETALQNLTVVLRPIAFNIATVTIKVTRACVDPEDTTSVDSDFHTILAELRKNAERERLLVSSYPFEYRIAKWFDSSDPAVLRRSSGTDTVTYRSDERPHYSPGKLIREDPAIQAPNNRVMMVPGLEDLGDPAFLRTHCFIYAGSQIDSGVVVHKIDFRPNQRLHAPDVEGSAFLDGDSFVIRRAIFRITRPNQLRPPVIDLQFTTIYREILPGVTVIGDVRSEQSVRPQFSSLRTVLLTERQRLLDVRFLKGLPGESVKK